MKTLKFTKMHGLGNDFMVVNAIEQDFDPLGAPLAQWADRYRGVGFDQFLVVEKPSSDAVDFRYRIFNADGREVEQCGNGARCFARFVALNLDSSPFALISPNPATEQPPQGHKTLSVPAIKGSLKQSFR